MKEHVIIIEFRHTGVLLSLWRKLESAACAHLHFPFLLFFKHPCGFFLFLLLILYKYIYLYYYLGYCCFFSLPRELRVVSLESTRCARVLAKSGDLAFALWNACIHAFVYLFVCYMYIFIYIECVHTRTHARAAPKPSLLIDVNRKQRRAWRPCSIGVSDPN